MASRKRITRRWTVTASKQSEARADGGHGKFTDSVDVQLSVTARVPKGTRIAARVIQEAIMYRAKHGKDPRGFHIVLIRWRNPDRLEGDPEDEYHSPDEAEGQAGWRNYGTQKERFDTLGSGLRGSTTKYKIIMAHAGVRAGRGGVVYKITGHRRPRRKKRSSKRAARHRPRKARRRR